MMKRILVSISIILWLGVTLLQAQYNEDLNQEIFKKHKGEILFSKKEIDLGSFSEKDIQSSFDLLDELYAQVILEKTLDQSYKENNYTYDFDDNNYSYNYALRLFVDDNKKAQWLFELPEKYFQYALTFDLVLSSNNPKEKRSNSDFENEWVGIISTLKEGKNKLKLEIIPININQIGNTHPVLASGSFTLTVNKNDIAKYLELRTTDFPPITMENKQIEEKIVEASDGIYPYAKPLRAFLVDVKGDWSYATDDFGNIVSRQITASVVYRITTSNKCWVKSGLYYQRHQGYGNFEPMEHFKEVYGYYDYQIPCWKIK